jgi:hypothetical protein
MSSSFGDGAAQALLQREPDIPEEQEEHQLHAVGRYHVSDKSQHQCDGGFNSPLLRHHQDALDEETLEDLRTDSLEEPQGAFPIQDEFDHLAEAFEGLAIPLSRRARLQTDLRNDERLCCDCSKRLGRGSEN